MIMRHFCAMIVPEALELGRHHKYVLNNNVYYYNKNETYITLTIYPFTFTKSFIIMATPFIDFIPAQVAGKKEVYVSFHVIDPVSGKFKRIRIRCNRIKNIRDRMRHAHRLCAETNIRLYEGWNPLTGEEGTCKRPLTITQAAKEFYRAKQDGLRKDSSRGYKSKLTFFISWCEKTGISNWLCGRFTSKQASELLAEYGTSGRSAYSYNNMLQFLKSMFKSFANDGLLPSNPFEPFKGMRREKKHRTTIPKHDRRRILNYFQKRGMTGYVAMMRLCFKHLVRPKEILMLRMCDVDFDEGLLRIPPEVSKNHDERIIALSHEVLRHIRNLHIQEGTTPETYLFSKDFMPGLRLYTTKNLFDVWHKMLERLSMPSSYHFYSLKDTGITEMLDSGMPPKYVRDLAGHHSLAMTERYTHVSDAKRILAANTIRF